MSYTLISTAVFWACAGLIAYNYLFYPLLVWCLARACGRTRIPRELSDEELPRISVLIVAHNEEAVIDDRIKNALAMHYPHEKLEVVIGSDGSSDGTAAIVKGYQARGVRFLDYSDRRGKAAVLNDSIPRVDGDLVLLSDANTEIHTLAARRLARWFADPEVGIAVGRLDLVDPATGRNADGLYWRYENFIKSCEAAIGALLGANGAIYAIRRSVYTPIPRDTIIDDFVVPLLSRLRTRCSIVYDYEARATEETSPDIATEFRRRARIGAGGFQSIGTLRGLLDPRNGYLTFTFISHKVIRWIGPFLLLGLLAANTHLATRGRNPFYQFALAAQLAFYAASASSDWLPGRLGRSRLVRLPAMFAQMNAALFAGFWMWLLGLQKATWRRTPRIAEFSVGGGQAPMLLGLGSDVNPTAKSTGHRLRDLIGSRSEQDGTGSLDEPLANAVRRLGFQRGEVDK